MQKYQLYAGKIQDIPAGVKYSLVPTHHQYLLIYTDIDPKELKGFVAIDDGIMYLNAQERAWLAKSKTEINVEYLHEHEEYLDYMNQFLDVFEQELKAEAEQTNGKTNDKEPGNTSGPGEN